MTWADWQGYKALAALEPWGSNEEDRRAAVPAAVLANVFIDKKLRSEPFTEKDFMPQRTLVPAVAAEAAIPSYKPARTLQIVEAMSLAMHGRDRRKKRPRYN